MKILILLFIFFSLSFGIKLNQTQIDNIKLCLDVTKYLGYKHYPCAILLNESSGKNIVEGDLNLKYHAYGIMQIQLRTAKFVINHYKLKWLKTSNTKLKNRLKYDKVFNITIGCLYFKYLKDKYKKLHKAVIAYNSGYYNPNNQKYLNNFYYNNKIITLLIKQYF